MTQRTVIGFEPEALARLEAELKALDLSAIPEPLRARLFEDLAAARAHAYRVPAREQGITVTRPEVFVWAAEELTPDELRAAAEAFTLENAPRTLTDAVNRVSAWASKVLADASAGLPSPADRFYFPAVPATAEHAAQLEALGGADHARELRELLARGEPAMIGTTAPPTPEGTLGWLAWNLLRGVAVVARLNAAMVARLNGAAGNAAPEAVRADAEAFARAAFLLGVQFTEARAKEMHEAEALAGRKFREDRHRAGEAGGKAKRKEPDRRAEFVRGLPPGLSRGACSERLRARFPGLRDRTYSRTLTKAGRLPTRRKVTP